MSVQNLTILCISSYEKGFEFLRQAKREGWRVLLLTSQSLRDVEWPRESIDEIFYMPDINKEWNLDHMVSAVSYLARTEQIDRIVALDDFDVEKAARLREHLRVGGMGDTTARYFRDKLAMRVLASELGIKVPEFVHILNYKKIEDFLNTVSGPYVLKPRMQAGAVGIKKINNGEELWRILEELGDRQSNYLLERFVEGNIYHVDSIVYKKNVVFAVANEYAKPPMEVAHEGRVFTTRTMLKGSDDEMSLLKLNEELLKSLGLVQGISHSEFIKSRDGEFYFLETSARVGGANIAEMIEAATGINLWAEWAKIETLPKGKSYKTPTSLNKYSAVLISLAKQENPDLSSFNDEEVYWKMKKPYHAGIIVASANYNRISELIANYTERFYNEFFTSQPLRDKPTE